MADDKVVAKLTREDFHIKILTEEIGIRIHVSEGELIDPPQTAMLLQIPTDGGEERFFACAYLNDDQARELIHQIQVYLSTPHAEVSK